MLSTDPVEHARQRLGETGVAEARQRGEQVPAAQRVTRACQLCRTPIITG
jgi:hypothetical protein